VVGADSATAAIMFAGLVSLAQPQSAEWVALAGWLALLAAVFLIAARTLNLGFLADFLSSTVLIGFLTGVGIQVACGQVAGMLGVAKQGNGAIEQAAYALLDIANANRATLAVSASVIVIIVGARMINKKIPGALIAVVGTIAASAYWDLAAKGVTTLGPIPSGLPTLGMPALPPAGAWGSLAATAASLFFVILAQSAATSRAYAQRYDETSFEENGDLTGLAFANVTAALSGTFVVNGSPTKTQMVDGAGGRSQLSQLTTAAVTLIVLLFLTKPLSYMPNAVLAAVVFLIGVELVDVVGMRAVFKSRQVEFWVAMVTATTVVAVGVEQGIFLAIALSLVVHVRHSYHPTDLLVTYEDGEPKVSEIRSEVQAAPGLMIYRFGASLYYANAETFQAEVTQLVKHATPPLEWFVLDASAIGDVDYTGAQLLRKLIPALHEQGITFGLASLSPDECEQLESGGITELVGKENIHVGVNDVMRAFATRERKAERTAERSGQ
jgi:MFS superfamily sulfate permease-like transporter